MSCPLRCCLEAGTTAAVPRRGFVPYLQCVRLGRADTAQCRLETDVAHCRAGRRAVHAEKHRQPVGRSEHCSPGVGGRSDTPGAAVRGAGPLRVRLQTYRQSHRVTVDCVDGTEDHVGHGYLRLVISITSRTLFTLKIIMLLWFSRKWPSTLQITQACGSFEERV